MSGVTWNHRREGDWLASNGRWYPRSSYPKGWNYSSLPPAPHHRDDSMMKAALASAPGRIVRSKTKPAFSDTPAKKDLPPPPDDAEKWAAALPAAPKPPAPPKPPRQPPAAPARVTNSPPASSSPFDSIKRRVEQAIEEAIE